MYSLIWTGFSGEQCGPWASFSISDECVNKSLPLSNSATHVWNCKFQSLKDIFTTRGTWATSITQEKVPSNTQTWAKLWIYCKLFKIIIYPPPPYNKGVVLNLIKLEFQAPKDALCHVSMKLTNWLWRFFNVYELFSLLSLIIRGHGPLFIWTHLNHHYPRKLCAKFGWNLPGGSGNNIFKSCQCTNLLCHYYLPL